MILSSALSFLGTGCEGELLEPRPQWLVVASTDALVPQFADRLLVELLDADGVACSACQRQFHATDPGAWPFSFGAVPTEDEHRVRIRLYRGSVVGADGTPAGEQLIDGLVTLPATSTLLTVHVPLAMQCFGVPARVAERQACDPQTGELTAEATATTTAEGTLATGSWPPAQTVPCAGDAPTNMVCVEGGAFLLGDALAEPLTEPRASPSPERIVQLAPFWIDATEFTVGRFKALRGAHPQLAEPVPKGAPGTEAQHCTYQPSDSSADDMPLNCLTAYLAAELCALEDKQLPTEAQWEFAAGNGTAESLYGWGPYDDICSHAVVARGGMALPSACQEQASGTLDAGPAPVGTSADVGALGIGDMSGNVAEWVADAFAAYDEPCWGGSPPLVDPICAESASDVQSVRGGRWASTPIEARITYRHSAPPSSRDASIGFRCVRSAN
ncbi:MAG: formylglycine-generating enzyme family protein [Deltaproteobacteria bacterium]|nr:formylglycine-generating enzyme family protein [Deltaproteobacteria bacterium]MBW2537845.1 formylglycine-generating enzyme family protein [Deltaproteobacteria bacterium]